MSAESERMIYKIVPVALWHEAQASGVFSGAPIDHADGFIHFSTAAQVAETASKHFSGQLDLLLVAVDPHRLGDALKWEASRGGADFPHLYAPLSLNMIAFVKRIPIDPGGEHDFSGLLA